MTKLFGTDGVRSKANVYPMTPDIILKIATILGNYITTSNPHASKRVIIGKDTRQSGYMIENALTAGFLSSGMNVILTGPVPTPAISMLTKSMRADLGVMISASHNPYEDNGIKIFGADGIKIPEELQTYIEDLMTSQTATLYVPSDKIGKAKRFDDVVSRYIEFVKATCPRNTDLRGLKIVLDSANGAAYKIAREIFWELGAEVIAINNTPDGKNINANCGSTYPEACAAEVLKHKADIGISLDGDADRLIIIDENGRVIDGDFIIAAIALSMKEGGKLTKSAIVATVMSNLGFEEYLQTIGIDLIRTKVGDKYVAQAMQMHGVNLGGEKSGHIIQSDYSFTGDGLISALKILVMLKRSQLTTSQTMNLFRPSVQIEDQIPLNSCVDISQEKIDELSKSLKQKIIGKSNIVIRKSGTEPIVRIMIDCFLERNEVEKLISEAKRFLGG